MVFNFSWEAASWAVIPEVPKILWNAQINYRVYNSPPIVPILSQLNPVHITLYHLSMIQIILSTPPPQLSK
jgi:hypothetical protein